MSYEDLAAHATEIKQLAIDQTVNQLLQGSAVPNPPISTYQSMAEQTFAGTDGIFDEWYDLPDPYLLGGGAGNIEAAAEKLSAGQYLSNEDARQFAGGGGTSFAISQIEPSSDFMSGWQSGTALSYQTFAGMFGPITANLAMCANVLKGAAQAELAIWEKARDDVDGLAHATIDALKACTDKSPKDVAMELTVIGAVSGIVAVPFTAGGSLAASYTFAAIAAGTGIGGAFVPDEEEHDSPIQGDTPREIVESLTSRLTTLNTDITTKERDVKTALTQTKADFDAAYALDSGVSPVKMPRPSLADNPTLGDHD